MSHNIFDSARYASSEMNLVPTTVTIKAEHAKAGDVFKAKPVTAVKVGRKWVYVTVATDNGGTSHELPIGAEIEVVRNIETEESKRAGNRTWANREICKKAAKRTEAVEETLAEVTDQIANHGYANEWAMANLLSAQADLKIHNEFVGFATRNDFEDAVAAKQAFVGWLTDRVLAAAVNYRAISRSTSVVSNVMEDLEREAVGRFIDGSKWDVKGL